MASASSLDLYYKKRSRRIIPSLCDLIRFPTVNPPGVDYEVCVKYLEKRLRRLGMKTKIHKVPDRLVKERHPEGAGYPRYNLIGRWNTGSKKTVHFNAHYDVVPASAYGWTKAPFRPYMREGYIYGRGSCDMKGSIACVLFAIEALKASGVKPRVNVEVSFTADEETGGELGAGYVVKEGLVEADFVIVCEGGNGQNIGCGHNGIFWTRVEVRGKPAHAANPHRGVNALIEGGHLIREIQKIGAAWKKRKFKTPNGLIRHPTLNIGGEFGTNEGAKVNTVPSYLWFTIDRRVLPNEKLAPAVKELLSHIRKAARKVPEATVAASTYLEWEPCMNKPTGFHKCFAGAVEAVRGEKPGFHTAIGANDMHYFVKGLGIPGLGYGPGGSGAHGINERVEFANLVRTSRIYADFLSVFDGGSR
jgi:succinyl-diaminopimelate desuccinylase